MKTNIVHLFLVSFAVLLLGGCEKKQTTVSEVIPTQRQSSAPQPSASKPLDKKEMVKAEIQAIAATSSPVLVNYRPNRSGRNCPKLPRG